MTPLVRENLRISLSEPGKGVHVVRVDGRVDAITAPELDGVLGSLIGRGDRRLVVDLAGVNYISSAGWGIFVSRLRAARDGDGDIVLARMTQPVRSVYDLLEFDGLLPTAQSLEAAQGRFNAGHIKSTPPAVLAESREESIESTSAPDSWDAALVRLVLEDPFYSIGELRTRLAELGHTGHGRLSIFRALWIRRLWRPRQRFSYYRRHRRPMI